MRLPALTSAMRTLRFIKTHPLGSQFLGHALRDWLRWQVGGRLALGPMLVPFVEGTSLLIAPGMTGATGNIYCGLHEAQEMGFLLHFLREGDSFVDVGANVGTFSILAAGVVGARTWAFEPIPVTFQNLMRNVRCNNLQNLVDARCMAVGAVRGEVMMTSQFDTTNHILEADEASIDVASVKVPIYPLDEILNGAPASLVKIDVEGREGAVLEGAQHTMANPGTMAVIVEVLASTRDGDTTLQALKDNGYTPVDYNILTRKLVSLSGLSKRSNTIFVRDIEQAQVRVRLARKFRVKSLSV